MAQQYLLGDEAFPGQGRQRDEELAELKRKLAKAEQELNLPNAASGLSFSANTTLNASSGSITGVGDVSFDTPGTTHTIDASYNVSGTTTVNGTNTVVDVNSTATFGGLSLQNGGDANLQAANLPNAASINASSGLAWVM